MLNLKFLFILCCFKYFLYKFYLFILKSLKRSQL